MRGARFYGTVRTLFHPIGRCYFGLRVEGTGRVPAKGCAILAANHVSWLDPIVLGAACPRPIRFLMARSVYERRGGRWFYDGMRVIPVSRESRNPGWLRTALRALGQGEIVGVFPEGAGLSAEGVSREPRPGALVLAALSGAACVPVAVSGTHDVWPPTRRFPRPGLVTVRFGEPYTVWTEKSRPGKEEIRASAADLMQRIRDLQQATGPAALASGGSA